ncbi:MAG: HesA/MoeB/ThiF family protein [Bacteroidia bacterium]
MDYSQQILVNEIGQKGQKKINDAKVLIIGAGGLGTPLATYLTSMGIGRIGIMDGDKIAATNLHRQFLYHANDVGEKKVIILKQRLSAINPNINIEAYDFMFKNNEACNFIINQYQIICDCSDNSDTRILINNKSFENNKILIYGAVKNWEGYVTILNGQKRISLNQIFSEELLLLENNNNCNVSGIISSVCGIIGSIMATEAIKIATQQPTTLDGSILCFDALNNVSKLFKIKS